MSTDELLTTAQVADMLGLRVNTLEHWRTDGKGPRFLYVGSRVRYRRGDVDEWVRAGAPMRRRREA